MSDLQAVSRAGTSVGGLIKPLILVEACATIFEHATNLSKQLPDPPLEGKPVKYRGNTNNDDDDDGGDDDVDDDDDDGGGEQE